MPIRGRKLLGILARCCICDEVPVVHALGIFTKHFNAIKMVNESLFHAPMPSCHAKCGKDVCPTESA